MFSISNKFDIDAEDSIPMLVYSIATAIVVGLLTSPTLLPDLSNGGYALDASYSVGGLEASLAGFLALAALAVAFYTNQASRRTSVTDRWDEVEMAAAAIAVLTVIGTEFFSFMQDFTAGEPVAQIIIWVLGFGGFYVVSYK